MKLFWAFAISWCILLIIVFIGVIYSQVRCSKSFCPKDMKLALVRNAGCICLIEAK